MMKFKSAGPRHWHHLNRDILSMIHEESTPYYSPTGMKCSSFHIPNNPVISTQFYPFTRCRRDALFNGRIDSPDPRCQVEPVHNRTGRLYRLGWSPIVRRNLQRLFRGRHYCHSPHEAASYGWAGSADVYGKNWSHADERPFGNRGPSQAARRHRNRRHSIRWLEFF